MTRTPAGIALAAILTTAALAQTSTTARRPAAHRRAPATPSSPAKPIAAPANPADNPPNVPRIEGTPKPLYPPIRYVDIVIGTGDLAPPRKYYSVRYTGWLTDGTKFDSSDDHPGKQPFPFPYGGRQVIIGWDTGFEGMRVGGKRRLYIPYQLAYGELGRPGIPPKADLIFDLELVAISDNKPDPAPPTPIEPTTPPSGTAQPATEPADPTNLHPPAPHRHPISRHRIPPQHHRSRPATEDHKPPPTARTLPQALLEVARLGRRRRPPLQHHQSAPPARHRPRHR